MNMNGFDVTWSLTEPDSKGLTGRGDNIYIQNMTDDNWEQLGRDFVNDTHLSGLRLTNEALSDHRMACLFRGLTRSSSIARMELCDNDIRAAGIQSMVPFLQNANNLTYLDLDGNLFQCEGFNAMFRALSDSPIETLYCNSCEIMDIEIDRENIPKNLMRLSLNDNIISDNGCYELSKLLQRSDSSLKWLDLGSNNIYDDGVEILVDALQSNTSLIELDLSKNTGISKQGQIIALKLVSDISSIKATLQSNHTLQELSVEISDKDKQIQRYINMATEINSERENNPEAAGRQKVIYTQLNSVKRAELAEIQGVTSSVFSEIDPLHLPEVLALVSRHHYLKDMYVALRSTIAGVISTVDRKQCLKQQRAELKSRLEAIQAEIATIDAELVTIEAAEEQVVDIGREAHGNDKRRRI